MTLIGHDDAWAQWRAASGGERMHHAWMLAGKRGVGKMTFAQSAARELVAQAGVAQPENHPDILVLDRLPKDEKEDKKRSEGKAFETKRSISVDQIRAMQQRLTTRPTLGTRRAIIIDSSDDLEKSASNALLKSLEEPPVGTFFLLIAHRPARLLPTIRSRCRILRFPAVSDQELRNFLGKEAPEANEATVQAAIAMASGSPGAALDFVERDFGALHQAMVAIVRDGDPDFQHRARLSDALGMRPDREKLLAAIDLARSVVARSISSQAEQNAPPVSYPALVDAHAELVKLGSQAPTYNFDAGLLIAKIGILLASAAPPRN